MAIPTKGRNTTVRQPPKVEDKKAMRDYLSWVNEKLHELMGLRQNTVGYGTEIKNRKWQFATNSQDGIISKEDHRMLSHTYDYQIDATSTTTTTYVGWAERGSATSDNKWQIRRVVYTSGHILTFADGDELFDNIWDDRTSLTYKASA